METEIITIDQIDNRKKWINKIRDLSGDFGIDSEKVQSEIRKELTNSGNDTLLGHLRLCGTIPESYPHDSTEEKLYSKYTDVIIHEAFTQMGFNSLVLRERADVADVECVTDTYSFVADAKAFRLSRTAKNQKDFKVQAMDNWKHGKPFAIIVCPIYQLPSRSSQIYQQAGARSVCISTYSHLSMLIRYTIIAGQKQAITLMHRIFQTVDAMIPSKNARDYWSLVNRAMLDFDPGIRAIWKEEKVAAIESIKIARDEALTTLAKERERIMRLTKDEAITEILKRSKIEAKIAMIEKITNNGLLDIE